MSSDATATLFSKSCLAQREEPQSKLDSISSGLGATLATFFAINCAITAFLFLIWRLADVSLRSLFWRRYGWFVSLIFLGSVGGALNAAAGIQYRYFFQRINRSIESTCAPDTPEYGNLVECYVSKTTWMSRGAYWFAVSYVPYGIEFLCLCCSKLLVIERMVDFVTLARRNVAQRATSWLTIAARIAMVCVTISNIINISFLAVAANYQTKASLLFSNVAAALGSPEFLNEYGFACFFLQKCPAIDDFLSATDLVNQAVIYQGHASICEGFSLVIILISFVVAGIYCIRRFNKGNTDAAHAAGRQNNSVRVRIFVTVFTVFVSFLMRSVYAVILAISRYKTRIGLPVFSPEEKNCDNTCMTCQQLGVIVQSWIYYNPEFSELIILVASPLTMLIAAWGMTTPHFVQKLRAKYAERQSPLPLTEKRSLVVAP